MHHSLNRITKACCIVKFHLRFFFFLLTLVVISIIHLKNTEKKRRIKILNLRNSLFEIKHNNDISYGLLKEDIIATRNRME